jgi:hypothetical protein
MDLKVRLQRSRSQEKMPKKPDGVTDCAIEIDHPAFGLLRGRGIENWLRLAERLLALSAPSGQCARSCCVTGRGNKSELPIAVDRWA